MNLKKLREHVHTHVRLRPTPIWHDTREAFDQDWWVQHLDDSKRELDLFNSHTRYHFELGLDHVKNFATPNFLILSCQIYLGVPHKGIDIEPLSPTRVPKPTPEEVLTRALLDNLRAIPGGWDPKYKDVLDDPTKRQQWLALATRDASGGVILPALGTTSTLEGGIYLPLMALQAARQKLEDENRATLFHPLDE